MAKQRRGRPVNGVLIVDKPSGQSSNKTLQVAKWQYAAQKAGHTGSLDPLATGVLPLCFGEATKFSQFLLDSDKAYRSTFRLGITTASGDADGEVIETHDASGLTAEVVEAALMPFRGEIMQRPSMYSALKHQGQPLYKLARRGQEVERKLRAVMVYELDLEAFRGGDCPEVDVLIRCSKGTYVRSIAEDLGVALGCGAHVSALRRIGVGQFSESQLVSPMQLEALAAARDYDALDALLLPVDIAVRHFPAVTLAESASYYMLQGQAVQVPRAPTEGMVRMYADSGDFLGIGAILDDGRVGPKRLLAHA